MSAIVAKHVRVLLRSACACERLAFGRPVADPQRAVPTPRRCCRTTLDRTDGWAQVIWDLFDPVGPGGDEVRV
jgi:hypothetical protein